MNGSYLGNEFNQEEIEKELTSIGANFETLEYNDLVNRTSDVLSYEKALVGSKVEWSLVQGRWEEDQY